jgi:hypothetical protein
MAVMVVFMAKGVKNQGNRRYAQQGEGKILRDASAQPG